MLQNKGFWRPYYLGLTFHTVGAILYVANFDIRMCVRPADSFSRLFCFNNKKTSGNALPQQRISIAMNTQSNNSYTSARQTSRGLVTPDGARIVTGMPFTGLGSGRPLAFVRFAIVPAGFYMPGGWGGAGSSEWRDDGAETPCAGTVTVTAGNPSTPASWTFTPGGSEAEAEDFSANAAAYKAVEDAEKADNARRAQQHAAAVEAVTEIIRWAYERNLFCEETVREAQAEAKRLAPDGDFGSWHFAAEDEPQTRSAFGGNFPRLGRCQMSSMGTGRDVQILQVAINRVKATEKVSPVLA